MSKRRRRRRRRSKRKKISAQTARSVERELFSFVAL